MLWNIYKQIQHDPDGAEYLVGLKMSSEQVVEYLTDCWDPTLYRVVPAQVVKEYSGSEFLGRFL